LHEISFKDEKQNKSDEDDEKQSKTDEDDGSRAKQMKMLTSRILVCKLWKVIFK
jgi:hypothetical protein